jgi:hypothetical protein
MQSRNSLSDAAGARRAPAYHLASSENSVNSEVSGPGFTPVTVLLVEGLLEVRKVTFKFHVTLHELEWPSRQLVGENLDRSWRGALHLESCSVTPQAGIWRYKAICTGTSQYVRFWRHHDGGTRNLNLKMVRTSMY